MYTFIPSAIVVHDRTLRIVSHKGNILWNSRVTKSQEFSDFIYLLRSLLMSRAFRGKEKDFIYRVASEVKSSELKSLKRSRLFRAQ